MARKFWWATSMPDQLVQMQNFRDKIDNYATQLGLTPADVTAAVALCDAFIGALNATELCRSTMMAMKQWRDDVFNGEPVGKTAPPAPVFPVVGAVTYTVGVVKEFFELRDRIVASPGYSMAIGEDLGIVGAEISAPLPGSILPNLKAVTSTGYWVNLSGSMQGMDALRVEYSRDGGENFTTVAFLTNTPGGFQITPANPGQAEKGFIRAVYIKRNEEVGGYSANYPVTLS
jgi:hypothetical protein